MAQGQKEYGLDTYVTGQTALNVDISAKLSSALPAYLAINYLLCVVLLVVVFRSILVPLAAVIGYVVSVLAALGAVTFVFQQGHLDGVFGIARPGPVLSFLPIILLGILFGLAMDYEVFLESRMREEPLRKDATTAVIDGYSGSAKVVASAAIIIMIAVFASFIFSADPTRSHWGCRSGPGRPDRRIRYPHDGHPGNHVHPLKGPPGGCLAGWAEILPESRYRGAVSWLRLCGCT